MHIGKDLREVKLGQLLKAEGYASIEALYPVVLGDVVSPANCVDPNYDYICKMEPDQEEGYCDECHRNTVAGARILADLI